MWARAVHLHAFAVRWEGGGGRAVDRGGGSMVEPYRVRAGKGYRVELEGRLAVG